VYAVSAVYVHRLGLHLGARSMDHRMFGVLANAPGPTQQALRTLEWIGRKENVVICGPSGTGKGEGARSSAQRSHVVRPRVTSAAGGS
jgi:hypothetical protein